MAKGVTSLSPGRAIVVLRRIKTGAIGHGVPVTPDERAPVLVVVPDQVLFNGAFHTSFLKFCP